VPPFAAECGILRSKRTPAHPIGLGVSVHPFGQGIYSDEKNIDPVRDVYYNEFS